MPNIKSAKKRVLVTAVNREKNMAQRSELKTAVKKASASIAAGAANAQADLKNAAKELDIAATRGLIHKNKAARKKSRMTKKLNAVAK